MRQNILYTNELKSNKALSWSLNEPDKAYLYCCDCKQVAQRTILRRRTLLLRSLHQRRQDRR